MNRCWCCFGTADSCSAFSRCEGGSFTYRHLITAAEDANVTMVEEYIGSAGVRYFTNVVTEAFVADGAKVDHYKIQRESTASYFQTLESELGRDALFSNHAHRVIGPK